MIVRVDDRGDGCCASWEFTLIPGLQINSSFLPSSLLFSAVSWDLSPQLGRVSVILALFRFLISSVAHAGNRIRWLVKTNPVLPGKVVYSVNSQ